MLRAGEGEYVPFAADCSCEGPVEVWLQNVVDAMRAALSAEFKVTPSCILSAFLYQPNARMWRLLVAQDLQCVCLSKPGIKLGKVPVLKSQDDMIRVTSSSCLFLWQL